MGSSGNKQVCLPLESSGIYDFIVDWDDGNSDTITTWDQAEVTHTYTSSGVYALNITGTIIGWRFNNWGDQLKLIEIQQWGCLRLGNMGSYFSGCRNLVLTATDSLNLTGTTSLNQAFRNCTNLGSSGTVYSKVICSATNMESMFYRASSFNQEI